MRIAYVLADNVHPRGTSGAATHVRQVVAALRGLGHEVEMIRHDLRPSVEPSSSVSKEDDSFKKQVVRLLPNALTRGLRNARKRAHNNSLVRGSRELLCNCDAIYERDTAQSFLLGRYAKRHGLPWVVECNGLFWGERQSTFHRPVFPSLYRRRHLRKLRQADHIIAVSSALKQELVKHGISASKVTVIHNGVNLAAYDSPSTRDTRALRDRLGVGDALVIGFIGHMLPKHNIHFLIESLEGLLGEGKVRVVIVGGGRWQEYRQLAEASNAGEHIVFTGPVRPEDVPAYVSLMDICTLPGCHHTDSPVKLFDYGAARKPVIAPDMPNIREVIDHNRNGLLFKQDHQQSFNDCLHQLIADAALRSRLGEDLYENVKCKHTWASVGQRTEEIIRCCVEGKGSESGVATASWQQISPGA